MIYALLIGFILGHLTKHDKMWRVFIKAMRKRTIKIHALMIQNEKLRKQLK